MTRFRAIIIGAILFLLMLAAAGWLARIPIVSLAAESYLTSLGIQDAHFDIQQLTTERVRIANVTVGADIQIREVIVHYTILGLLSGQVAEVEVEKAVLDVSRPDKGVFKSIQAAIAATDTDEGGAPKVVPQINLKELSWRREDEVSRLSGEINGSIGPDGEARFLMSVAGNLSADGYPILLEGLEISLTGNILRETAVLSPSNIVLKSGTDKPQFPSLILSLAGESTSSVATGEIGAELEDGTPLLKATLQHDLAKMEGEAQITIQKVQVGEGAIRPELLLIAFGVPPIKGSLSADITSSWTAQAMTADGQIKGERIELLLGEDLISLEALEATVSSIAKTGEALPLPTTEMTALNIAYKSGDDLITAPRLQARLSGDLKNIVGQIEGEFSGEMSNQKIPASKFKFDLTGEPENLSLQGGVSLFKGALHPTLMARVNISERDGEFTIQIPSTKLGPEGADLSSWVAQPVTGDVDGQIEGAFRRGNYTINRVQLNGRDVSLTTEEGVRARMSLQVLTENVTPNSPFRVTFQNLKGEAAQNTWAFRFDGGRAVIDVLEGWASGTFKLEPLVLSPNKKNDWKTPLTISSDGSFDQSSIMFSGLAKTPLTGPLLEVSGRQSLKTQIGEGTFRLLTLPFTEGGLQPSDFWRTSFDDLEFSGDVSSKGTLSWGGGDPNGTATVELSDVSAFQEGLFVEGVQGRLQFDSLMPLVMSEMQTITADRMFVGIPLGKSEIAFRLKQTEAAPMLLLDRVLVEMFQGAAEIKDGVIDLASESNTLQMRLFRLSLKELMALGEFEDVNATGALSGVIPLNFNGETLIIDEAVLAAEEPGILQITSEDARQALSAGGSQTKLLFDILENFKYSNLSLQINKPETGEDVISLHAEGGNPDVENNRPVILNVNLSTNFDKIFNTVLEGYRLSEKALRATVRNRNK